ncbi:hypothetical protein L7F22_042189 [Adiantum nelumboides]|nr:hypothetical protein [Adiantum nelumboides]
MSSPQTSRGANGGGGTSNGSLAAASTKDLLAAALQARVASNNYIAHLKIWESVVEGGSSQPQRKARYLILAVQRDTGRVTINKAKRNANGSFSIGKDWDLNQLREISVDQSDAFTLTLSRSYSWGTEKPRDQILFLQSLVKVFRKYTGEDGPKCIGFDVSSSSSQGAASTSESNNVPVRKNSDDPKALQQINTSVSQGNARGSPLSASSRPRGNSNVSQQDGFYDPRNRTVSPTSQLSQTIPTISTSFVSDTSSNDSYRNNGASSLPRSMQRRPTLDRQASAAAVMTPSLSDPSSLAIAQEREPQSLSQGNSPNLSSNDLPTMEGPSGKTDKPIKMARSPSRVQAKLAAVMERAATPTRKDSLENSSPVTITPSKGREIPTMDKPPPPKRPPQVRTRSSDSIRSSLSAPTGGDARARLSSIEPVRGGAAYEKMLLAGTGLNGVAEGDEDEDEDEDPYGGADISDVAGVSDILPRNPSKRKVTKLNEKDVQDAKTIRSEVLPEDDEDATLMNVEEMLEGFEFRSTGAASAKFGTHFQQGLVRGGGVGKGTADIIEARLLDELAALDAANIHAIIESDDRVNFVVQHIEQALHELDVIDSMIAGYKIQLNARDEDISHIESQNRGLQVQTSNQRALSAEIEKLLDTVHVDEQAVDILLGSEMQTDEGIGELEMAGAALYKAMLQARRTQEDSQNGDPSAAGLAAATERLEEYSILADRFAKRLLEFLTSTFNEQTYTILHDPARIRALKPPNAMLTDHSVVEIVLGRYCGLLLYAKEVSPNYFSRISAAYFASASERYKSEMTTLINVCKSSIASTPEDEVAEASFIPPSTAMRSNTIRRPNRDRNNRNNKAGSGEMSGSEAFARILASVTPLVAREQMFIADLLHINNNAITFADYMDLEAYFRRRAAAIFGGASLSGPIKNMKDALDLIFGFLAPEWQALTDGILARDKTQIVGILAALDRGMLDAEEVNSEFLLRSLSKLQMRLSSQLEKYVADQIRGIEQTKLTAKKRKGVVHFIKAFPVFVDRIEAQIINGETLQIRAVIDNYYDQLCSRMFDALQTMAIPKIEGGTFSTSNQDEDKGLLNHHVILVENMFHLVKGITRIQTQRSTQALNPQLKRAQAILDEALNSYVQSALRRPLGKMVDFGDGIDALLRSTPANEVSLHSAYSKQAAKRLVKEFSAKDIRKAIEALSKRVQKHFDEDEITILASQDASSGGNLFDGSGISADEIVEVLSVVWRHCEDAFTHECERLMRILKECYLDGKLLAEFTMEDVRRPFASNSPAGRKRH